MLFKCFAELEFKGPTPKPSEVSVSLLNGYRIGILSRQVGTSCTSNITVLSVTMEGRHLLIYLFNFYYVTLATFLRQYFFF